MTNFTPKKRFIFQEKWGYRNYLEIRPHNMKLLTKTLQIDALLYINY